MPLEVYHAIRDQRLDALRAGLLPRLPADRPFTLEIGCGHGHYLAAYAAAFPGEFCVGIDRLGDRIERAARKAVRAHLSNLLFAQAEAGLFLQALASEGRGGRLRRVFILFSDPWPKRRHWKNRLMRPDILSLLVDLSTPDAALHFRTDHPDYFAYALKVVREHPSWRLAELDEPAGAWPFEYVSVFEERALAGAPKSFTALRRQVPPGFATP